MVHLHDYSAVRQRQLQKLQDIRENLNYSGTTKTNGPELLGRLEELFLNWNGYLPNLREIFGQKAVEHLLFVSVKNAHANKSSEGKSFVNFAVSSGYKDEPDVDENGKPVLRRDTALHHAARLKCKKRLVGQLFDVYDKFDVNYVDRSGLSHFHVACEYGLEYPVENFLEHGHDPNCAVERSGDSTLHMALRIIMCSNERIAMGPTRFEYCESKDIVELLLRAGANPNAANKNAWTPLHIIAERDYANEIAELFFRISDELNQLVQIDVRNHEGNTPLHVASSRQRKKTVELLLRRGADPTLVNEKGQTPLHLICAKDSDASLTELFFEVIENLGKTVEIDARNKLGYTPLQLALRHKKKKAAESLLRHGANPNQVNETNRTFLHELCRAGQIDLAEIFFNIDSENRRQVLVDYLDNEGNSPLHLALEYEQKEAVELLLRNGADPTLARKMDGYTPLHIICTKKEDGLMKIFFHINDANNQKVDIDAKADDGSTPLHLALRFQFAEMAEILLRRGADPNSANDKGDTPLHFVCEKDSDGSLMEMFFEVLDSLGKIVQVDARNKLGHTPMARLASRQCATTREMRLLLSHGTDPNSVHWPRFLHDICREGAIDLAMIFFKVNGEKDPRVQIDVRDGEGNTPLHSALENDQEEVAELMLRNGANPDLANKNGYTPLHIVCRTGCDLTKFFFGILDEMQQTVQMNTQDNLGNTPLHLALDNRYFNVAKLLLRRGPDPTLVNAKGETPLGIICKDPRDSDDLVRMMFNIVDEKEQLVNVDDLLQSAVANGHVKVTKLLLRRGANPHPLLCQIFEKFTDSSLPRIVSEMIDNPNQPMPIDARETCGNHDTLLHLALRNGRKRTAALLLKRGVDANLPNAEGDTPLHIICHRNGFHLAELLFASTNRRNQAVLLDAQNNKGDTPLHLALGHGTGRKLAKLLLRKGADSTLINEAGETLLHVVCKSARDSEMAEMLFGIYDERRVQAPLDSRDACGNTPLHNLAYSGHDESSTCELLLARGADPNVTNNVGRTPLHIACDGRDIELSRTLSNHERLRVDVADQEGNTALHLALERQNRQAAESLLRRRADPNVANAIGETALHAALQQGTNGESLLELFFEICDEIHLQVEIDAVSRSGYTALGLAVFWVLPDEVDLLLSHGADLSNFVFPTRFGEIMNDGVTYGFHTKLKVASDFLAVVEILEKRGYDTDRSEVARVMKVFARYGLLVESPEELENFWRDDEHFANEAIEQMVKPGLTLYELIRAGPKEAAKLVTLHEFSKFARAFRWYPRHRACADHLREKMSRGFFRSWIMEFFMELIHYRLPLECCDMIIDESFTSKNLCNICLAAAPRTDEDAQ